MTKPQLTLGLTKKQLKELELTPEELKTIAAAQEIQNFGFIPAGTRLGNGMAVEEPLLVDMTHGGPVTIDRKNLSADRKTLFAKLLRESKRARG